MKIQLVIIVGFGLSNIAVGASRGEQLLRADIEELSSQRRLNFQLHTEIHFLDVDGVQKSLLKGAQINGAGLNNPSALWTLLSYADGHRFSTTEAERFFDILAILLQEGSDLDIRDSGQTIDEALKTMRYCGGVDIRPRLKETIEKYRAQKDTPKTFLPNLKTGKELAASQSQSQATQATTTTSSTTSSSQGASTQQQQQESKFETTTETKSD